MQPYIQLLSLRIPSYGFMMMVGIFVASALGILRTIKAGLRWEDSLIIGAFGIGVGLLGAILLYGVVTFGVESLLKMLLSEKILQAEWGLIFYGGLMGAIPGVMLGGKIAHTKVKDFIVPLMPCLPLGHAFGRIGCFLAGCCYGRPTNLFFSIKYTQSFAGAPIDVPLVPVQLMESAALFLITVILLLLSRQTTAGQMAALYAVLYAGCRFFLEFLRYDTIRGHFLCFSTSQWISIGILGIGIISLIHSNNKHNLNRIHTQKQMT